MSATLNDQTKVSVLCHAATRHLGKGTEAAVGAIIQVLTGLRYAVLYKDIVKHSHVTKDFLIGRSKKVAMCFLFVLFFLMIYCSSKLLVS